MIRLWEFTLSATPPAIAAARDLLAPLERRAAARFATPELEASFILRRAARRRILARIVGERPEALRFVEQRRGKPVLERHPELHFSASNSGDIGILAVGPAVLGADIEVDRPLTPRMVAHLYSPGERRRGQSEPLRTWCGKEAVIKAEGSGIRLEDLPLIDLYQHQRPETWRRITLRGPLSTTGPWYGCWIERDGAVIALAAPRPMPVRQMGLFSA